MAQQQQQKNKKKSTGASSKKSSGGSSQKKTSAKKKSNGSTALALVPNGKKSNGNKSNGRRSNGWMSNPPSFKSLKNAFVQTGIGTLGGLTSRVGADLTLNLATYAAPQVGIFRHWAVRPALTAVLGWFATPRIFGVVGFNPSSQDAARVGGLIASGFDFFDGVLPNARERVASKFRFGRGDQDVSLVATNGRTALPPAQAEAIVENAAQAGAAAGAQAAMAGLGMMDSGIEMQDVNDSGELSGRLGDYDPDWYEYEDAA